MSTETEHTNIAIPVLASGTGASFDGFVVKLASWAVDGADESVESLAAWAFALVGDIVVNSSSSAGDTSNSVPG